MTLYLFVCSTAHSIAFVSADQILYTAQMNSLFVQDKYRVFAQTFGKEDGKSK